MNRTEMADLIVDRIGSDKDRLTDAWRRSGPINHCHVDDLLPPELAMRIREAFPAGEKMKLNSTLRERKFIGVQVNQYVPIIEEALYAFQDPRVVDLVGGITGLRGLEPDELLYAGGISMMAKGHFLNPHIDNSHDKNRDRYRALNLLYYVSPGWQLDHGGNLELWPTGVEGERITIESRFNRLAIMVTHKTAWHSVSPIASDDYRCCVSNYYFSKQPVQGEEYFHVTTFRGRPEQKLTDLMLRTDGALRMAVRKVFPKGAVENKHYYAKDKPQG